MNRNDHKVYVKANGETTLIATVPIRPSWGVIVAFNAAMCEDGSCLRVGENGRHEAVLDGKVVRVYWSEPVKFINISEYGFTFGGVMKPAPHPVQAWSTEEIVTTVKNSLRSGAKKEFHTSVGGSRVYIQHAWQIRVNDGVQVQVDLLGEWEGVTVRGIGELAQQEHLNWCMDDGTVWMHDQDIMTLPGAG